MQIGWQLESTFTTNFKCNIYILFVIVPNNLEQFQQCNYGKLEKSVKQDLDRWRNLSLTLMKKISIIKMNVLPRFLFLFQNLPIYIPQVSNTGRVC